MAVMEAGSRVTCRLNEVETGMDTIVNNLHAVDTVLLLKIRVEPGLDIVHDWLPAVESSSANVYGYSSLDLTFRHC